MILIRLQTIGAACALALAASGAGAQGVPPPSIAAPSMAPPQAQNPVCSRLEAQLASLDRGGDGGRADQVRRYEEAVRAQQAEINRTAEQVNADIERDKILSAQEALEYGLIDQVLTSRKSVPAAALTAK